MPKANMGRLFITPLSVSKRFWAAALLRFGIALARYGVTARANKNIVTESRRQAIFLIFARCVLVKRRINIHILRKLYAAGF